MGLGGSLFALCMLVGLSAGAAGQWCIVTRLRGGSMFTVWVAVGVGFLTLGVMGELDSLIGSMRTAADPERSLGWLTRTAQEAELVTAVRSLESFSAADVAAVDALRVTWLFVLVDSAVFVTAYLLGGRVYAAARRAALEREVPDREDAERAIRLLGWAGTALVVLALVDWVENLGLGALVSVIWSRGESDSTTDLGLVVDALRWLTTVLYYVKWATVALLATLVVAERRLGRRLTIRDPARRDDAVRLRPLLAATVAFMVLLMLPVQIADVLLDLGSRPSWKLLVTIVVLAAFSFVNLAFGTLLLWDPRPGWCDPGCESEPTTTAREIRMSLAFVVVGAVLLGSAILLYFALGWSVIVFAPAALTLPVGCLNWMIVRSGPSPDDARRAVRGEVDTPPTPVSGLLHRVLPVADDDKSVARSAGRVAPSVLAAAPWWILGTAMITAGFGDLVYHGARTSAGSTVAIGFIAALVGLIVMDRARALTGRVTGTLLRATVIAAGSSALCLAVVALVMTGRDPVAAGRAFGATALLVVFLTVLAAALGLIVFTADRFEPPRILRHLGVNRWPLMGALMIWLIAGVLLFPRDRHDVRAHLTEGVIAAPVLDDCGTAVDGPASGPFDVEAAFDVWRATNDLPHTGSGISKKPIVIVSASGGGIRAAWWAAAVMGDLAPDLGSTCASPRIGDARVVFAATGISGGSLGLATHTGALLDGAIDDDYAWVDTRLGEDHLSPTLAWMTYVEVAQAMLGFPTGRDRGEVMEASWNEPWGDVPTLERGLRSTWFEHPQLPMLVLTAASAGEGCRMFQTPLSDTATDGTRTLACDRDDQLFPQAYGLDAILCPGTDHAQDIRLVSAALNSARFPLITPSGRETEGACATEVTGRDPRAVELVDGGYLDANGAEAAADLWTRLAPLVDGYGDPSAGDCLVPIHVQLIDDFEVANTDDRSLSLPPLLGPLEAALSAFDARNNIGDERIDVAFEELRLVDGAVVLPSIECGDRFQIVVRPEVRPGVNPSLGWSLSPLALEKIGDAARDADGTRIYRALMAELLGS